MTEATQRFCCRAGFLLLCLLPTLAALGWIGLRQTKAYATSQQRTWQTRLARTLGLAARIERIEEPRPGQFILHGVTLLDPDAPPNHGPLARAKRVQLAPTKTGYVVLASEGEITSLHLPRLWSVLHERLVRGPEVAERPVHVAISKLTLIPPDQEPERALALADVRLQLASSASGAYAVLEFRQEGQSGEPARLSVARNRTRLPVATQWSLHTGAAPLPCQALAPCFPQLHHLGRDATFHGVINLQTNDATWNATAAGEFRAVNLDELVSDQFPHHLSGTADIVINDARWQQGTLVTAAGQLNAYGGAIGQSLWEAAARTLHVQVSERLYDPRIPSPRHYTQLALGFQLDGRALYLSGRCEGSEPDTIVADQYGALVKGGVPRAIEPVSFLRTLVPDSHVQVPAVSQVRQLLYTLPLPEALPAELAAERNIRLQPQR